MNPVLLLCTLIPTFLSIILLLALILKKKYSPEPQYRYYNIGDTNADIAIKVSISFVVGIAVVVGLFYIGVVSKTDDVQILNGEVTSKERIHDTYTESYQCNCRTVYSGSGNNRTSREECDTCYRTHYTVDWGCKTTIGPVTISHEDSTNDNVYDLPDPPRYLIIQKGDPVSKSESYTNWIRAVPDSIFKPLQTAQVTKYAGKIPPYPEQIYDIYRIDRVFGVGISIPDIKEWNSKLSNALRTMGPVKQANAIVVLTSEPDAMYAEALRDSWVNGKKNDIVVVMGISSFDRPANWVKILALTKENIFQVHLRDRLMDLPNITSDNVINTLQDETMKTFKRKRMKEFEYLKNEILPSTGFVLTMFILVCIINIVLFFINFD
jgi:hypothetical protein